MADKVQKIKEWISKTQDGLMDTQGNFEYPEHEGAFHILTNLDYYIDSLQEEPVSENLKDAATEICSEILKGETVIIDGYEYVVLSDAEECFKAGAKWQKRKDKQNFKELAVLASHQDGCLALENIQMRLNELIKED